MPNWLEIDHQRQADEFSITLRDGVDSFALGCVPRSKRVERNVSWGVTVVANFFNVI